MTFQSEHDARIRERVEALMVGAKNAHTVDEIRKRLEKIHGVRFTKADVVAALGSLKRDYELEYVKRSFPHEPTYRLRPLPAKQTSLFGGSSDAQAKA